MFLDVKQMKAKDERANQWSHCIAKTSSVCSGAVTGVFVHENIFNISLLSWKEDEANKERQCENLTDCQRVSENRVKWKAKEARKMSPSLCDVVKADWLV